MVIGKIAIPSEILTKPTRLSKLEMEMMRGHAQAGYDILKDVPFPTPVAEIIRQHHERMDGSGYPQGLRGDAILPEARVLAVAVCHLTKNRFRPVVYCYSAALLYIPTYVLLYALFGSDLTLLGIYLPIMVVEPAIVKRMEFSDLEPVRDAFRHGFNNALGMCVVLLIVGCLRELLATGAVFGNVILHNALLPLAALPAGGFVIVGILAAIWCAAANLYTDYKHEEVRRLYADRKH